MSCDNCLSPKDCVDQCQAEIYPVIGQSLVYRLRKRAEIRRQISTRKSVQEGQPDRIADLLEEAASSAFFSLRYSLSIGLICNF